MSSHSLFKVEENVGIKLHHGEINGVKLNQWLQRSKVYFNVHNIGKEKNISFI
jgi:hypothetical protein